MEISNLNLSSKKMVVSKIKISKPIAQSTTVPKNELNILRRYTVKRSTVNKEDLHLPIEQHNRQSFIQDSHESKSSDKATSYSLAKQFENLFNFKIFDEILHVWNGEKGYYIPLSNDNADMFFRRNTPKEFKPFINSRNVKEIVSWIKSECSQILNTYDLFENRNYVTFNNGQFNISTGEFTKTTSEANIFSKLNADYGKSYRDSIYFEKFMEDICCGDHDLYLRIQEFFGYVISEIRDLKLICFLIGPKDSGKSIILKLLEYLIGPKFCTNLSLDELNKQDYLNRLLAKKLNTCGEVSEISLQRLDNLKKLSGGDKIMSKALYDQPVSFVNSAALVFAGNHLPEIKKIDRSNAFADRLLVIPFTHQIPKDQQDPTLFNKLLNEINYIAHWALQGLVRFVDNNYTFSETNQVTEIMDNYKIQSNSIEHFIKINCSFDPNYKIFKEELEKAYYIFCEENNVVASNKNDLHKYMKSLHNINFKRIRIGSDSKNGYVGIALNLEVSQNA